jgi:uncharacterized membrane protein
MMDYKLEHKIFRISIFLKGIYSLIELLAGFLLLFITSSQIYTFVQDIFRNEILEDPQDFIANFVLGLVGNLPSSIKLFIALYLLIHGVIKLVLIIGLWKEKLYFYPIAIAVFGLFIFYQIYSYVLHPSLILLVITDLDMLIIILTLVEWRKLRRRKKR